MTRRYSDFRRLYELVKSHLPIISASLPAFPGKQFRHTAAITEARVKKLQEWLRAVLSHVESWRLREILEFLDDTQTIASNLTWRWDNWQSPVLPVNSSVDLEQLQMDNLFLVLRRGSSVQAQGVLPLRDYITGALAEDPALSSKLSSWGPAGAAAAALSNSMGKGFAAVASAVAGSKGNDGAGEDEGADVGSRSMGQPFSIILTKNGLHMGRLSGRVLVRRVAMRERVVHKLSAKASQMIGRSERKRQQKWFMKTRSDASIKSTNSMRGSHWSTDSVAVSPMEQPALRILTALTDLLTVSIKGSEKIIAGKAGKSKPFTVYIVACHINGRRWVVKRRYSQFHNLYKLLLR